MQDQKQDFVETLNETISALPLNHEAVSAVLKAAVALHYPKLSEGIQAQIFAEQSAELTALYDGRLRLQLVGHVDPSGSSETILSDDSMTTDDAEPGQLAGEDEALPTSQDAGSLPPAPVYPKIRGADGATHKLVYKDITQNSREALAFRRGRDRDRFLPPACAGRGHSRG